MVSVAHTRAVGPGDTPGHRGDLGWFRLEFYRSLTARADALFELADAVLCADGAGPVAGRADAGGRAPARARRDVRRAEPRPGGTAPAAPGAGVDCRCRGPPTGGSCSRSMSARGCARTPRPARTGCSATSTAAGAAQSQLIPGWPYSFVAALETGRTSWTAVLDAVRLGPADDATAVTAAQLREVVEPADRRRAVAAGRPGHPDRHGRRLRRHPAGLLLADLPVELVGPAALGPGDAPADARPGRPAPPGGRPAARSGVRPAPGPSTWHDPRPHHHHRHHPLRHRDRDQLGPAAPPADPPRRLARSLRRTADHRTAP